MYETWFGFAERPFGLLPDASVVFWSPQHRRAYEALRLGLARLAPLTVVTGVVGAGKTTLLRTYLEEAPDDVRIGLISNFTSGAGDILHWVLMAFDLPDTTRTPVGRIRAFEAFCREARAAGQRVVLILDEAQNASDADLERLRLLSNLNDGDTTLMLVLVGQPELGKRLAAPALQALRQRIGIAARLGPLSASETALYVRHRLARAGGRTDIFDADALAAIHAVAKGVPRVINNLADLCLLHAFGADARRVDGALAEAAIAEARAARFLALTHTAEAAGAAETRTERQAAGRPGGARPVPLRPVPAPDPQVRPLPAAAPPRKAAPPDAAQKTPPKSPPGSPAPRAAAASKTMRAVPPPPRPPGQPRPSAAPPAGETIRRPAPAPMPAQKTRNLMLSADTFQFHPAAAPALPLTKRTADPPKNDKADGVRRPGPAPKPTAAPTLPLTKRAANAPKDAPARGQPGPAPESAAPAAAPALPPTERAANAPGDDKAKRGNRPGPASELTTAPPQHPADVPARRRRMARLGPGIAAVAVLALVGVSAQGLLSSAPGPERPAALTAPVAPAVAALAPGGKDAAGWLRRGVELAADDPAAAAIAYARAALRGSPRAATYLGQIHETGEGVAVDLVAARAWYDAAAPEIASAARRAAALEGAPPGAGPAAPPVILSAGNFDGMLEIVWTSGAGADPAGYRVSLADASGTLLAERQVALTATRLAPPPSAALWQLAARFADGAETATPWYALAPAAP